MLTKARRYIIFSAGSVLFTYTLIGGWVNPRARLDAVAKRDTHASAGNKISLVQPVA
jgi:hypothetical protein